MFKRIRKPITNKETMKIVYLLNKAKKILAFAGLIGIIWSSGPMQYIQAMDKEETIFEVTTDLLNEDGLEGIPVKDYISTSDYFSNYSDALIEGEVLDLRDAQSKTFIRSDNTLETVIYQDVVHFLKDGTYEQIDNSLLDLGNELENKENIFKVKFPKKLDDNKQIKMKMLDYGIDWSVIGIQESDISYDISNITPSNIKELTHINQSILYSNIINNVDLEYILTGSEVKENIILNEYISDFSMTFEYKLKNLEIIQDEFGNVNFVNESNQIILTFQDLFMIDSNENYSENISFVVENSGNKTYNITVVPDDEWLRSATYPVQIDPTYYVTQSESFIFDTTVESNNPTLNYDQRTYMRIGSNIAGEEYAGLVYFIMPEHIIPEFVTSAKLTLTKSVQNSGEQINVYRNTSSYNSSTVTWNTRPSHSTEAQSIFITGTSSTYEIDITSMVKYWQTYGNYGMTITADEHGSVYNSVITMDTSTQTSRPVVEIIYIDAQGLKDYWTYDMQPLGDAGVGMISENAGIYSNVRNDISFSNEKTSLSLDLTYAFGYRAEILNYGRGWRTNYDIDWSYGTANNVIVQFGDWGEVSYDLESSCTDYISDSTEASNHTCYLSEEGDGSVIAIANSSSYTTFLISKEGQYYEFNDNHNLSKILFSNGKDITIQRGVNDRIDKIIDGYGNYIYLTYLFNSATQAYRLSSSYLYTYDDTTSSYYKLIRNYYSYQTDSTLNYVSRYNYFDTSTPTSSDYYKRVEYDFDSSYFLKSFTNSRTKNKVTYTYTSGIRVDLAYVGQKISSYKITNEANGTKNLGEITFDYTGFTTVKTDHKGNKIKMFFDAYGHTIGLQDDEGNASYTKYLNNSASGNENLNNKIISSTDVQSSQMSFVANSTFYSWDEVPIDTEGGWYKYIGISGAGTIGFTSYPGNSISYINRTGSSYGTPFSLRQKIVLDAGIYTIRGKIDNAGNLYNNKGAFISVTTTSKIAETLHVHNSSGFEDVSVTFEITSDNTVVYIDLNNESYSYAKFDDIQIDTGFVDERINYLQNPSFEYGTSFWTATNPSIETSTNTFGGINLGDSVIAFTPTDTVQTMTQYVDINLQEGDAVTFGGWTNSLFASQNGTDAYVKIVFEYTYYQYIYQIGQTVPITQSEVLYFSENIDDWQYVLDTVYIRDSYNDQIENVKFKVQYRGENHIQLDGLQLYKEEIYTNIQYNDNGNVEKIYSSSSEAVDITYDSSNENMINQVDDNVATTNYDQDYVYDSNGNLVQINNENGVTYFTYDTNDPDVLLETKIEALSGRYYKTSTTYTNQNQYLDSKTNEYGDVISYDFNVRNSLLEHIELPSGDDLYFDYDKSGMLTSAYINNNLGKADYTYDSQDRLSTINVNGLIYTLNYNDFGQITSFVVDGVALMTNEYKTESVSGITYYTNLKTKETYANGNQYVFEYNDEDLLSKVYFKEDYYATPELRYEYKYDSMGRLTSLDDYPNTKTFYYQYNNAGSISKITDESGNFRKYDYNDVGQIISYEYSIDGISRTTNFNYTANDTKVDTVTYYIDSTTMIESEYFYDSANVDRLYKNILWSKGTTTEAIYTKRYYYDDSDINSTNGLSKRVNMIVYEINEGYETYKLILDYEFDSMGNLIKETEKYEEYFLGNLQYSSTTRMLNYGYDDLNQLVREDICESSCTSSPVGSTITYTYNTNGNRTYKKEYSYTNPLITPSGTPVKEMRLYYNSTWKDKLTSVQYYENGTYKYTDTYTYDAQGNVTKVDDSRSSYYDDNFTWDGRENTGNGGYCESFTYTYNDSGYRTGKEINTCGENKSYEYVLDGDRVLVEFFRDASGSHTIHYTYDYAGKLISMNLDGTEYFYQRNLLEDIIGLYDINGNKVVFYEYDGFGNITDMTDSDLARYNPYRYRGYRYDEETSFYYLNSRYYNPDTGRFINADGYIGDVGTIGSHNMFTYVKNNPILYVDPSGYVGFFASMAIGFAVEAALTLGFPMLKVIPFLIDILAELITMVIINVLNKLEALYGITPETIITIAITAVAGGLALGFLAKKIGPLLKGKKAIAEAAEEGMDAIGDVAKKAPNAPKGGVTNTSADVVEDTLRNNQFKGSKYEKAYSETFRIDKNTILLDSPSGTKNYRIPDFIDNGQLYELKNVATQSYTAQLKDLVSLSDGPLNLVTPSRTKLTGPLLDAINSGQINHIIWDLLP